jgi:hypothetical protein
VAGHMQGQQQVKHHTIRMGHEWMGHLTACCDASRRRTAELLPGAVSCLLQPLFSCPRNTSCVLGCVSAHKHPKHVDCKTLMQALPLVAGMAAAGSAPHPRC